jgi:putative ABC transport system substrate-binding protein
MEARQAEKTYRVGVLSPARPLAASIATVVNLLPPMLRELGYIESNNLVLEQRFAQGKAERLPELARELGIELTGVEVRSGDYDRALAGMSARADAVFVLASSILNANQHKTIQLTAHHRLPAIYEWPENAAAGGLMAYGTSLHALSRRVASYVDRILEGAKPAELPVEQPTDFQLVINLKTAKQIGLTIPAHVLARADRVIR